MRPWQLFVRLSAKAPVPPLDYPRGRTELIHMPTLADVLTYWTVFLRPRLTAEYNAAAGSALFRADDWQVVDVTALEPPPRRGRSC